MMDKQSALMIAVAMGTPLATAKANLDAAFPDPVPVAGPIGHKVETIGDNVVTTEIHADGTMIEVSRKPVPVPVPDQIPLM